MKDQKKGFFARIFGFGSIASRPRRSTVQDSPDTGRAPPPAGPAAPPGTRTPDERKARTRKKGTPDTSTGARKSQSKTRASAGSTSAPPPNSPHPIPANKPDEHNRSDD
jgi:hypothetical protein